MMKMPCSDETFFGASVEDRFCPVCGYDLPLSENGLGQFYCRICNKIMSFGQTVLVPSRRVV